MSCAESSNTAPMKTFFATSLPRRELSWPGSIRNSAATKNPSVPRPIPARNASSTSESSRPSSGSKLEGVSHSNESPIAVVSK